MSDNHAYVERHDDDAAHRGFCECDQCCADDAEDYAIYLLSDRRALLWETYKRNHPDGQPLG